MTDDNSISDSHRIILDDVHKVFKKWFYKPDTNMIDVLLSSVISHKERNNHLWIFFKGNSGCGKSEILSTIDSLDYVLSEDRISPQALCSGKPDVEDLGYHMNNKDTILLIKDLASLKSLHPNEKKALWSHFRTMYDGELHYSGGGGVARKKYEVNTTLIGGTTHDVSLEYLIFSELGTRELFYDVIYDESEDIQRMTKVYENSTQLEQMKKELKDVVENFLKGHTYKQNIEITKEMKEYIFSLANRLKILRCSVSTDGYTREVNDIAYPEVPTRLVHQFIMLYRALKSIDSNYPDERIKEIMTHIVESSSFHIRSRVLSIFLDNPHKREYKLNELTNLVKSGYNSVKRECEILWALDVLGKETIEEERGLVRKDCKITNTYIKPVHYYVWNEGKNNPLN